MVQENSTDSPFPNLPTSTRASSRKNRVYVFREFLLQTYGIQDDDETPKSPSLLKKGDVILDVAGGKGDLSWLLCNVDDVHSVIVDPRPSKSDHLLRSVAYLRNHPELIAERSIPGLPTYQPLACLVNQIGDSAESIRKPKNMRILVNEQLVEAVRHYKKCNSIDDWNLFWNNARKHVRDSYESERLEHEIVAENEVSNAETALLDILLRVRLIVGFHPDQATEASIDLAMLLNVPFAMVPCCVFPSEFPHRTNIDGTRVRTYTEFIDYLCRKTPHVRKAYLNFFFTDTAKNQVLYTMPSDLMNAKSGG